MKVQLEFLNPLASFLKRSKRTLVQAAAFAVLVAFGTLLLPNYYRSEAKILPGDSKVPSSLGQVAAAAAALGIGLPTQDTGEQNYVDIINSRRVREAILNSSYRFHEAPFLFGKPVVRECTLHAYLKSPNLDRSVERLRQMLFASRDLRTKVITVYIESRSPELSQQIVENAVKNLEDVVGEIGRNKGREKARFLEARLSDTKAELLATETAFRRFCEANRNYMTSSDPSVRISGAKLEAELKLRQQMVQMFTVNYEQALLEQKNDVPVVNVLDRANLPIDKSRPKRSTFVAFAFLGWILGALIWGNRQMLLDRVRA